MIRFKQVVSGVLTGFLFCGSAISGAPLIAAAKTETTYSLTLDKTENGSVAIFDAEKMRARSSRTQKLLQKRKL